MAEKTKNLLDSIKDNWVILAFIVQLIVTFTLNNVDHISFEKRIATLETKQESEDIILSEIKSRLASIETSLIFIKERVK